MAVDIETIGVGVDTSGVRQGSKDLDTFGRSADQASRKADQLGKQSGKASKELLSLNRVTSNVTTELLRFGGGLLSVFTVFQGARIILTAADNYTKLSAQLRIASSNQQEFNTAMREVSRIANGAQTELQAVATLYGRLNLSLKEAGRSQVEISTITESVALALRVNGASAAESASAMLQLSQAFGSGVLRGEEFNAVMEAAPGLMRQLAQSMGIPVGQLRSLASEGRITADELVKAFTDSRYLSTLREQAKSIETIGGAFTKMKNEAILAIGEIDKKAGTSKFFAALFGGAAFTLREVSGRGGNTTEKATDPEQAFFQGLRSAGLGSAVALGETRETITKQAATFAELSKGLRITSVELDRLNEVQAQANREFAAGNLTAKQHAQILAGVRAEREKIANKAKEDTSWYTDLVRQQDEMVAQELEARDKRIAKIREEQASAIESLTKQAMGWDQLSQSEQTAWEIQNGRFKDFDQQSKDELARLADLLDVKKRIADLEKENLEDARRQEDEAVEESLRLYKKKADEQRQVWDSIEKTAHDTFVSIFDSGKSAFDRLRDTLKNGLLDLLYQMTLKKWILNIGAAVTGGASGSAMAGLLPGEIGGIPTGSGGGVGFGSIKSVFDVVTKGFEAANNLFLSGIQDFGASVANLGGVFTDVGGWIGQYSGTIASVAPFIPSIISILSGDLKGGIASGIGAGIGMAIGGPVGGAIGSALGSLVGGLFGGDEPKMYGAQANAYYSSGELRSNAKNYGRPLGGDALKSIKSVAAGFVGTLGNYLKGFGIDSSITGAAVFRKRTTVRGGFWGSLDGQPLFYGKKYGDNADMQKSFEEFVNSVMGPLMVKAIQRSRLADGIKMLFSGMTDKTQVLNMMNATLSLNSAQEQLAERFGLTVDQAGRVSKATGKAGDDLIAFVNNLAGAANSFKTAGEVLIEARDALTATFSDSGGGSSLPGTLKAFDDILKGIDKTTQAGIEQFAELYQIRDGFLQYTQAIDSLKGGVKGALFGIVSPGEQQAMMQADLAELFGSLNLQIPGSVQELINLGKSIDYTTEEGLNLAAAFPSLVAAFQQAREQVDALTESLLDVNRFATLVDYTRAQRYASSGIDVSALPSYDVGTSYVPKDGPAMIHQGERIMTRTENAALVNAVQQNANMASEIKALREEMRAGLYAVATNTGDTAKRIRKWDGDGMPETRDITV
jgi:tape measure domain-containing protein